MVTKWCVKFVIDVWAMDIEGYGKTRQRVKKLQFNVQNANQQER